MQAACAQENGGDLAMLRKASALLIAILLSALWTIGQSTFGDIGGVVKDPSQGAVPEAQVVLTRMEDNSQYPTATDADGAFHFVNLKPGHYDLAISASGFAEFKISSARDRRTPFSPDLSLASENTPLTIPTCRTTTVPRPVLQAHHNGVWRMHHFCLAFRRGLK